MADEVVRAFEMPVQVVEPLEAWETIRDCWRRATHLANWCVRTLLQSDVVRAPGMAKLPPMPKFGGKKLKGLYGLASETFGLASPGSWWSGACISAATICRDVERKYVQERLNVVWHGSQAPCTYRYPYPWPVHAQMWRAARFDRSGRPCVEIRLPHSEYCFPDGGVGIRLRGGAEFGRQVGLFRRIVSGSLPMLQIVIRERRVLGDGHRNGRKAEAMLKMVARLPAREARGDRVMTLCVLPEAFWVAEIDGRRAWVANAGHVRRAMGWLAAHHDRLQRLSQDAKMERRSCRDLAGQWRRSLDRCSEKHRRRMSSWLHEMAAHAAAFAERQGVAELCYDDSRREGMSLFPWHRLKTLLAEKCAAAGIKMLDMAPALASDGYQDALGNVQQ